LFPVQLPGKGLAQHPFLYAGECDEAGVEARRLDHESRQQAAQTGTHPGRLDVDDSADPASAVEADATESLPQRALLADVERRAIERALLACGGNRTKTAERLGISRRQLFDKIREYDLRF
jgi:DNA-binding NtrC family response regulator